MSKTCITDCYRKSEFIIEPFTGILIIKSDIGLKHDICIPKMVSDELLLKCSAESEFDINPLNAIKNPIYPVDYINVYYNLHSLSEIIQYFKQHTNLSFYTSERIIDLIIISNKYKINENIEQWTELIKLILKIVDNDTMIIKVLKKVFDKYNNEIDLANRYPLNILTKIKKYLVK